MKKLCVLFLAAVAADCAFAQTKLVGSFDDILYWAGSGTNRAALVLQWNDGLAPASVVWGFRWNGTATGMDMLRAIAGESLISDELGDAVEVASGADSRLRLGFVRYGFGDSLLSVDYLSPEGTRTQSDWYGAYWQYYVYGGAFTYSDWGSPTVLTYDQPGSASYAAVDWSYSPVGAADRPLSDGSWDTWSFAPDSTAVQVQQPAPATPPVPVLGCGFKAGRAVVPFTSVAGFRYQLEYADQLGGEWKPLGPMEPGTGAALELSDPTSALPAQRFYRVVVSK